MAGAVVTVASHLSTAAVTTTAAGEFVLADVPPHNAVLDATAAGYAPGAYGQRFEDDRPLDWDYRTSGPAVIRLRRLATIAGLVRDDHGEAAPGQTVAVLRRTLQAGRWRDVVVGHAVTDDRGAFRLNDLPAGEYRVAVTTVGARTAETPPGVLTVPTLFFPASPVAAGASAIALASGEVREDVNFTLAPESCVRLSGTLRGAPPGVTVDLALDEPAVAQADLPSFRQSTDGSSHFQFPCVPEGAYRLRARAGVLSFDAPIAVHDRDLADLFLTSAPLTRVSGQIRLDGAPANTVRGAVLQVSPDDGLLGTPRVFGTPVGPDGSFTVDLAPGGYVLTAFVPSGMLMHMGSLVTIDDHLNVGSADLGNVVVRVAASADMSGVVDLGGADWSQASLYLFPQGAGLWTDYGAVAPRFAEVRLNRNGEYSAARLPPGAYFVVALAAGAQPDWRDPVFLARLARVASPFTLSAGQSFEKDLKAVTGG